MFLASIRASETTGELASALRRYIQFATRLNVVREKAISAAVYPVILLVVGLLVTVFLLTYVVPRFATVYEDLGRGLPGVTATLVAVAGSIGSSPLVAVTLAALAAVAVIILARPTSRRHFLGLAWRLPYLGKFLAAYQLGRFHRIMAMLTNAGIPLVRALGMAKETVFEPTRAAELADSTRRISEGSSISQSLRNGGMVEEIGFRLLRAGENTGEIGRMFEKIADYYDADAERSVERLVRFLEPLLMLLIGLVIGFVVLVLYLPIFELAGSLE